MEGLLDLVKSSTGLDLADEGLFAKAGLDPAFSPLLFEFRGAAVLVLGLSDAGAFRSFAHKTMAATSVGFRETVTDGPTLIHTSDGLAFAVVGNLAVIAKGDGETALHALAALLASDEVGREASTSEFDPVISPQTQNRGVGDALAESVPPARPITIHWRLGTSAGDGSMQGRGLRLRSLAVLEQMGPAAGVGHALLGYLEGCSSVTAEIAPGDKYLVQARLDGCPFAAAGERKLAPESMLPDDTVMLLHWAPEAATLLGLFSGVQQALLARVWESAGAAMPESLRDIRGLLGAVRGEVALAFLGVSPTATLKDFAPAASPLDPVLALHLALVLTLNDGASLPVLVPEGSTKEPFKDFESSAIGEGPVSGWEFCRVKKEIKRCFSIMQSGRNVIVVTGTGEGPRVARVIAGRAPSLDKALFNRRESGALTFTLKTRRLVRDMTALGFPPYFLQVMSSVLEVRAVLDPADNATAVSLEVVLR